MGAHPHRSMTRHRLGRSAAFSHLSRGAGFAKALAPRTCNLPFSLNQIPPDGNPPCAVRSSPKTASRPLLFSTAPMAFLFLARGVDRKASEVDEAYGAQRWPNSIRADSSMVQLCAVCNQRGNYVATNSTLARSHSTSQFCLHGIGVSTARIHCRAYLLSSHGFASADDGIIPRK